MGQVPRLAPHEPHIGHADTDFADTNLYLKKTHFISLAQGHGVFAIWWICNSNSGIRSNSLDLSKKKLAPSSIHLLLYSGPERLLSIIICKCLLVSRTLLNSVMPLLDGASSFKYISNINTSGLCASIICKADEMSVATPEISIPFMAPICCFNLEAINAESSTIKTLVRSGVWLAITVCNFDSANVRLKNT